MFQEVKDFADRAATKALTMLKRDGYLTPVLLFMKKDGRLFPAMIGDSDEADIKQADLPQALKEAAPDCKAIILVCDSVATMIKKGARIPESEDIEAGTTRLLCTIVYHPQGTDLRKVAYLKGESGKIALMDMGWDSVTGDQEGFISNPFKAERSAERLL